MQAGRNGIASRAFQDEAREERRIAEARAQSPTIGYVAAIYLAAAFCTVKYLAGVCKTLELAMACKVFSEFCCALCRKAGGMDENSHQHKNHFAGPASGSLLSWSIVYVTTSFYRTQGVSMSGQRLWSKWEL